MEKAFSVLRKLFYFISPLFLFERKRGKKNQKSLQDLSALSVRAKTRKGAPLPARDIRSFPREHSAEPRGEVTICRLLLPANAREARTALFMGARHFAESEKSVPLTRSRIAFLRAHTGLASKKLALCFHINKTAVLGYFVDVHFCGSFLSDKEKGEYNKIQKSRKRFLFLNP